VRDFRESFSVTAYAPFLPARADAPRAESFPPASRLKRAIVSGLAALMSSSSAAVRGSDYRLARIPTWCALLIARWDGLVLVLGSRGLVILLVRHVMTDDAAADCAADAVVNRVARYAADHRALQTAFSFGRNRRKQGYEREGERCASEDGGLHR
jgi:hypothetical protein